MLAKYDHTGARKALGKGAEAASLVEPCTKP